MSRVETPRPSGTKTCWGIRFSSLQIRALLEHLRGRSMFASWKKSYCPIGADRYDCKSMRILSVPVYD